MKATNFVLLFLISVLSNEATAWGQSEADQHNQETIELVAHWKPFSESQYGFGTRWETLRNLEPAEATKTYTVDELGFLIPPADAQPGEVYELDMEKFIPLIRQLHAGATHQLHHGGPEGGYTCIAAENERYRRIRTRAHAEFKLEDGIYVPSQFAGDIVIERATGRIVAFRLAVPARRNNVDVNWHRKTAEGEVWVDKDGKAVEMPAVQIIADIGYCEQLELVGGDWSLVDELQWDSSLGYREVDLLFQREFYRFARVNWLPWEEAVAKSRESGKSLHVVALFGVLDDESC